MATRYYYLLAPSAPWGDYSDILIHGLGEFDDEGVFHLGRTGPFIPPITQPFGATIVTGLFRQLLEQSGLTGFSFDPVIKDRVVELNWTDWDHNAKKPEQYPKGGEPEDYVERGKHSPGAAKSMGDLWSMKIPKIATVEREQRIVNSRRELYLVLATTNNQDFVRSNDVGYCFVSERGKGWLETSASPWVEFEEASVR